MHGIVTLLVSFALIFTGIGCAAAAGSGIQDRKWATTTVGAWCSLLVLLALVLWIAARA